MLYCAVAGAFRRGRRGAGLGALIGLVTMVVTIAGGMQISYYDLEINRALNLMNLPFSPSAVFLVQSQATAIAGAFVAGWATRFIHDV